MANSRSPDARVLLSLAAVTAAPPSSWFQLSGFDRASYTLRVTTTAAFTGAGTLWMRGTNYVPQDVGCPAVLSFTAADAPAAAGGFTLSGTTGVLTVNPTGAGTFSASFNATAFPQFVQAEWLGGTGGGTVSINVTLSGW
jgi:hypothetical protein